MFAGLSQKNSHHQNEKRFRKGYEKLQPSLQRLKDVAEFTSLFSGLEPTGTAGVVFGVTSKVLSVSE